MKVLFWVLWVLDLVMGLFLLIAKSFRGSFTSSDPTVWFDVVLLGSLIGGLVLRLVFKQPVWSLVPVALPFIVLLVWYLASPR